MINKGFEDDIMIILVDLDIQTIIEIVGLIVSILAYVENRKK